ncbi:hypothetical protein AB0G67_30820 [Streptomyces sp. NPDC021056]|uniref:hypothetical protein n=1 Tax=Streptomyces sp. NPDC021056 TaxID=3155012 RepID=UPI0033CCF0FA
MYDAKDSIGRHAGQRPERRSQASNGWTHLVVTAYTRPCLARPLAEDLRHAIPVNGPPSPAAAREGGVTPPLQRQPIYDTEHEE